MIDHRPAHEKCRAVNNAACETEKAIAEARWCGPREANEPRRRRFCRWVDSGPTRFCHLHNRYLAVQSRHDYDDDDDDVDDSTMSIFNSRFSSERLATFETDIEIYNW